VPLSSCRSTHADAGTVAVDGNTIQWFNAALMDQTATLTSSLTHVVSSLGGDKPIHASVTYVDDQHNRLDLPSLSLAVHGCDQDGDAVTDEQDRCPNTPHGPVVDVTGCSVAQICLCDGPWNNHGEYVSCVAHVTHDFVAAHLMSRAERATIQRAAGRANCGKTKPPGSHCD
jgi:hypothetical protein